MVHIERVPIARVSRAVVYENDRKLPLSKIVEEEAPDLAFTGAFCNPGTWSPVCPVKADGVVLHADREYDYWALAWNKAADVGAELIPKGGESPTKNYVANCLLVRAGRPQAKLYYNDDVGGRRGRVAVGLTDTDWVVYGATDGSSGAQTPEECRDYMAAQGCRFAIMLDGGRKVNYYCREAGVMMEGKDPSQTLILLYLTDESEEKPVSTKKVVLDPGHGTQSANQSPDGTYIEPEFTLDVAKRMKEILKSHGVAVTMTRNGASCPTGAANTADLQYRCDVANAIRDLDLFVSIHTNAAGGSGWSSAKGWKAHVYSAAGKGAAAAEDMLERVKAAGAAVRSSPIVAYPSLYVLKHTVAPAVLLECGFHTNQEETALLKDDGYRQKLAQAQAYGILDYLGIDTDDTPEGEEPAEPSEADKAVAWGTENGIMFGNSAGDLMLDQPVTRKQFLVMLYRYHQKFGQ